MRLAGIRLLAERLIAAGGVAHNRGSEVAVAPRGNRNGLVELGPARASKSNFERREEERLVLAVVDPGDEHGTSGGEGHPVTDAAGALGGKGIADAERRRRIVVGIGSVEVVGAGARDESHLADGAELSGRAGDIHAQFLERFRAVEKRTTGKASARAGDGGPVDVGGALILAAAGERYLESAGSLVDLRRQREVVPSPPQRQRQRAQHLAVLDIGDV